MAKQIMRAIEDDDRAEYSFKFTKEEKRVILLAALLHDIPHVPFGHTLEYDFGLIPKHDQESEYREFLAGEIGVIIGDSLEQVIDTLTKIPRELPKPYHAEIIKDTISADLLDYLRRDAFGTGLEINWDNRILGYLKIFKWETKEHLCIEIGEGGVKDESVISETRRLLQSRYFLAERAYYYHTKLAADAMIGKAFSESSIDPKLLHDKGDDEFLLYLRDKSTNLTAQKLAEMFLQRKLFRTAYMIDLECLGKYHMTTPREFSPAYRDRSKARAVEMELASGSSFSYDDIVILCLAPEMNLKFANALMRNEKHEFIRAHSFTGFEEINKGHQDLWRLYVFAKPGMEKAVADKCTDHFGCPNVWPLSQRMSRGLRH